MEPVRRVDRVGDLQDTTPRPSEGGPPVRYFGRRASRSGIGLSEERSILSMPRTPARRPRESELPEFQMLRFLTLLEKAFCRQRRGMWPFDSASA
jgi:hypothetical protein